MKIEFLIASFFDLKIIFYYLTGLESAFPKAFEGSVAVLTPYKAQLGLLRSMASQCLRKRSLAHIDFATVDGFQVALSHWKMDLNARRSNSSLLNSLTCYALTHLMVSILDCKGPSLY